MSATATYLSTTIADGVTGPDGEEACTVEVTASVGEFDGILLESRIHDDGTGNGWSYTMVVLDDDAMVALILACTQALAVKRGRVAV